MARLPFIEQFETILKSSHMGFNGKRNGNPHTNSDVRRNYTKLHNIISIPLTKTFWKQDIHNQLHQDQAADSVLHILIDSLLTEED